MRHLAEFEGLAYDRHPLNITYPAITKLTVLPLSVFRVDQDNRSVGVCRLRTKFVQRQKLAIWTHLKKQIEIQIQN